MEPVRRAYAAVADQYIDLFGSVSQVHADDLALIARRLSTCRGTLLDLGCGPGQLTAYLRSLELEAIGVDVVPAFIHHARGTDPTCHYMLGSLHALPVATGTAAGVLVWYSLVHLPPDDLDRVLAELRRVMMPNGALVVGFFESGSVAAFDHKVIRAYAWPVDAFVQRLKAAGFTEVERMQRPGTHEARPHAALAAVVAD